MEYHSAIKRDKSPVHVTTSVNLNCNMISERSRTQKARHFMIPFVRHSRKDKNYRDRKEISDCQEG